MYKQTHSLFEGRRFDKNGNIIGEWWQDSALKEFDKRAHCIDEQYSKYVIQNRYPVSLVIQITFPHFVDNTVLKLMEANKKHFTIPLFHTYRYFRLNVSKLAIWVKRRNYGNINGIDIEQLKSDIKNSEVVDNPPKKDC